MKKLSILSTAIVLTAIPVTAQAAAIPVASYFFNNNLNAEEPGVTPLTPVDPLGANTFSSANVFGNTRTVYNFVGNNLPTNQQAGLSLNTTGLLTSNNQYSVETIFQFTERPNTYRRILDVQNRQSDNGFYVDPANNLEIFPGGSGTNFTNNVFHQVVFTKDSTDVTNVYLDGAFSFSVTSNVLDINNPSNLINFFLDNTVGGGQGEYSSGQIASARLYNQVLSAADVTNLFNNPFVVPNPTPVPEPADSVGLLSLGFLGAVSTLLRKLKQK